MNEFLNENLETIENILKETIKEKILDVKSKVGTKIYVDLDGKISKSKVRYKNYEPSNLEHALCDVPAGSNGFDYESVGLLKDNLSDEDFNEFVEMYMCDEELGDEEYDKAYKICSDIKDWKAIYTIYSPLFEKALDKHIDKYLSNLKVEITNDDKIAFYILQK